jgi:hypothetical protein
MKTMLLIDGHVHIYPQFNLNNAISYGQQNFAKLARKCASKSIVRLWLLTERSDCNFFQGLLNSHVEGHYFDRTSDDNAIAVRDSATKETKLYILAGRQLISSENLEICALASSYSIEDKSLSAAELVTAVNEEGGLAAVNWAPGKWFGERGQVVQKLFESFSPDELFISDTTMRPTFWPTPKLMQQAMAKGFRVISGSDPLPFLGEEKLIATYASRMKGDFNADAPATSLKKILKSAPVLRPCGRRSGFFTFARRQAKIMLDKKK